MMPQYNHEFPVDPFFKDHVLGGTTLEKSDYRWAAILLIDHPKKNKLEVRIYQWNKNKEGEWKKTGGITLHNANSIRDIQSELEHYVDKVPDA